MCFHKLIFHLRPYKNKEPFYALKILFEPGHCDKLTSPFQSHFTWNVDEVQSSKFVVQCMNIFNGLHGLLPNPCLMDAVHNLIGFNYTSKWKLCLVEIPANSLTYYNPLDGEIVTNQMKVVETFQVDDFLSHSLFKYKSVLLQLFKLRPWSYKKELDIHLEFARKSKEQRQRYLSNQQQTQPPHEQSRN